jgi:1-acyl-sn-glycerol-3-phosphate acyltransferase
MEGLKRRAVSVPSVFCVALLLVALLPLWLPLAAMTDLARRRTRLPIARLLFFALGWAWLESVAMLAVGALWMVGRGRDRQVHYRLQRWWAARLMAILRTTTGIHVETAGAEAFQPSPTIMLCRHASLADSLVSAWVVTTVAGMHPRYVLKRELLFDPCLDIVGNRLPNHFLDRAAADSGPELAALTALSAGMGNGDVAIIFPEGTRASPAKRANALNRLAERDPQRTQRLAPLRHLLPPRPAGAAALLAGRPTADVVIAWHIGFDGLDTFGGILRHLASKPAPVHFVARRIPRADVPTGESFTEWLDETWLQADRDVHSLLARHHVVSSTDPADERPR